VIRKKENLKCYFCGAEVVGNGYTDHCPVCLWGKHMDAIVPGDRASDCKGRMRPKRVLYEKGKLIIEYSCEKCGHQFRVEAAAGDNKEILLSPNLLY
jgi:predicted RNA-binding Zn-ribbon protein involved in translation (DUF1610 family)